MHTKVCPPVVSHKSRRAGTGHATEENHGSSTEAKVPGSRSVCETANHSNDVVTRSGRKSKAGPKFEEMNFGGLASCSVTVNSNGDIGLSIPEKKGELE